MRLNAFTSYFEILAVLNAGYAGVETFSIYTLRLLRGQISDMATIKLLEDALLDRQREVDPGSNHHAGLEADLDLLAELREQQTKFEQELQRSDREFADISLRTTPSFVTGTLFCIAILLTAGFEQVWTEEHHHTGMAVFFLDCSLIYMIANCWLPESITIPAISSNNALRIIFPGIVVAFFWALGIANANYFEFGFTTGPSIETTTIIVAIIIAASPCIFNLPRVFTVLKRYNRESKPVITEIQSKLTALQTLRKDVIEKDIKIKTRDKG